jgi:hypothetical protein
VLGLAVAGLALATACAPNVRPLTGSTVAAGHKSAAGGASPFPLSVSFRASTSPRWRVVYRSSQAHVLLTAVTAISPSDAWAVGVAGVVPAEPVVLRWNGARWQPVMLPHASGILPEEVQATAPNDVWIFGMKRGGPAEAVRFDGSTWRTEPLPAGNWVNASLVLLGPDSAWLINSACTAGRSPSACRALMAHWNGAHWSSSRLNILVSGLAEVDGDVWLAGVSGCGAGSGGLGAGSGRLVVLRQKATGWQAVSAEPVAISTSCLTPPQLAAGAPGTAWILSLPAAAGQPPGALFYWNGLRWADVAVPARSAGQPLGAVDQLTYDGSGGAWAGPFAHWTGRRWINVDQLGPGQPSAIQLGVAAAIPGSGSSWAVGGSGAFLVTTPSGPGVIAVNGPLPR